MAKAVGDKIEFLLEAEGNDRECISAWLRSGVHSFSLLATAARR
jgi:hypothetical protein